MTYIHNEIALVQKSYNPYLTIHEVVNKFPKSEKYSLGEKLKNLNLEMLELLIETETAKKDWKAPILEKASRKLGLLKLLVRMSRETKLLDDKKYLAVSENLQEIGRMIGGWLKTLN